MGEFSDKLGAAANKLGIELPQADTANNPAPTETSQEKNEIKVNEIRVGDKVTVKQGARFKIYRLAGGELNTDLFLRPRMGYNDAANGFLVRSLQPDDMVEIMPIRYSYKKDEGATYLVNADHLNVTKPINYEV